MGWFREHYGEIGAEDLFDIGYGVAVITAKDLRALGFTFKRDNNGHEFRKNDGHVDIPKIQENSTDIALETKIALKARILDRCEIFGDEVPRRT